MNDLYFEYKNELGCYPSPDEEYIKWLENKVTELRKVNDTILDLHNYKEDYEEAVYEIKDLQSQLDSAECEIRDLNYEIKIRPR